MLEWPLRRLGFGTSTATAAASHFKKVDSSAGEKMEAETCSRLHVAKVQAEEKVRQSHGQRQCEGQVTEKLLRSSPALRTQ